MAVKRKRSAAARRAKTKSSEPQPRRHLVLGIYGDTGVGKTRLIGTTPGKVLLIRSPVDHIESIFTAGLGDNIEERVISEWDAMNDLRDELRAEGEKYDWVWVDSWSLLQDVLMDDIWAMVLREKKERYRFGLDKQEHGINQLRMGSWMRHVIGADLFNLGWTAHAQEGPSPDLDEEGDAIDKLMPYIHGQKGGMAVKWCGYSTVVAIYAKDRKKRRILHTESSNIYYAKNQYDPNGKDWAIEAPTMPEILRRIERNRARPRGTRSGTRRTSTARRKRTTTRKGRS